MPAALPGRTVRCRLCGAAVPSGSNADICEAPVCQTRARVERQASLGVALIEQRVRNWERAQQRATPLLDALARRLGYLDASELPSTITPYIDLPSRARSAAEILGFVDHLSEIVREVFTGEEFSLRRVGATVVSLTGSSEEKSIVRHDEPDLADWPDGLPTLDDVIAKRDREAEPDPIALNAACIACGGHCCTTGLRHHAYLKPFDIAYYRHHHPDATPATLIADYLSRLPEKSVVNACLYLTETGCALPRQHRSTTCNRWQCSHRKKLGEEIREMGDGVSVVVGLAQDHDTDPSEGAPMARAITVRDGLVEVHRDLRLPALDDLPDA